MSHLLIKHIACFGKQRVRLSSLSFSGEVLSRRRGSIDPSPDVLVSRLQDLLSNTPRGTLGVDPVKLIFGSPWVRYACLPWQDSLKKDSDWESYARILLAQQYGVTTEHWRIRVSAGAYGKPRVAAGIEEGLYQTIAELCRSSKLKLAEVEPLFTTAVNQHRRALKSTEHALLVIETSHAIVGFYREKAWQGVIAIPIQIDNQEIARSLSAIVREAAVLAGQFLPEYVYVTSSDIQLASIKAADFDFEWLGPAHPQFIAGEVIS
ncbi:hypothetical protein HQ393_08005 [Chitinibacter bivalviorum]|uniref:Uncharacterized protein n=1 Tax=Chitinibacter bivalviorum TaxID=2739434 RepID=A0A7H9BIR8_9NEIS|nr:hypothetical protein [Chitinibacter bivalviorum]QLG88196.1 hypothetical protein HQ393_08005 [Chitinibacter bivalviorum]